MAIQQSQQQDTPNIVTNVQRMVANMVDKRTIHLPQDYSAENALKAAYLKLTETTDREGRNVLTACSKESITNALLAYVIQGLNVQKGQCYFIAYGKQLTLQRSYFGDMALAQRVKPGITFQFDVVREGEEFEFELVRGRTVVTRHKRTMDTMDKPIKGAYCCVIDADGSDLGAEVMTIQRIKKSWSMSKTYKPDAKNGTHADFEDEMCLRTVIRKRCKEIINSSSDAELLRLIQAQDMDAAEAEMAEEISANANGEVLDVEVVEAQAALPAESEAEPAGAATQPEMPF